MSKQKGHVEHCAMVQDLNQEGGVTRRVALHGRVGGKNPATSDLCFKKEISRRPWKKGVMVVMKNARHVC